MFRIARQRTAPHWLAPAFSVFQAGVAREMRTSKLRLSYSLGINPMYTYRECLVCRHSRSDFTQHTPYKYTWGLSPDTRLTPELAAVGEDKEWGFKWTGGKQLINGGRAPHPNPTRTLHLQKKQHTYTTCRVRMTSWTQPLGGRAVIHQGLSPDRPPLGQATRYASSPSPLTLNPKLQTLNPKP